MGKTLKDRSFCSLSKAMVKDEIDTYLELVTGPKFICKKCFRVARNKTNLCRPKKIKK